MHLVGAQYDIQSFNAVRAALNSSFEITFLEPALDERTTILADGHDVVCVFVNDKVDAPVLQQLVDLRIRVVALRVRVDPVSPRVNLTALSSVCGVQQRQPMLVLGYC